MARNNSSPVQQFRGTTAQHATYTGLPGELTVDTDKNVVVVHDDVTAGGHPMASAEKVFYGTNLAPLAEKFQALGNVSGTKAVNLTDGLAISATIAGATTFSFTDVDSTGATVVMMHLTNGGAYTITWPSSIKWAGGIAPKLTSAGDDIVVLTTHDAGATWYGIVNLKYA